MNRIQHTVLIIDDIVTDRVAIRRALRGDVRGSDAPTDYRVHEVENAGQALAYLREQQPDCLLLDYQLPDTNGLQLLKRIVEQARPHIYPVVMLTGAGSMGLAVKAMQQGVHDFLPKDSLTPERLQQAIHNAIEKVNLLRQLEEQREWFRLTLASIGDAVIATDQTGAVNFMNPVAEALTGITAGSSRGQPLVQLFRLLDEQNGQPLADPVDQVLRTHQVIGANAHALLIGRNGTRLPIAYNAAPIQDRLGNLSGVVLTFRDVSAHKAAESALRESEARLRLGMSVAGVAIAEVDYTTDTIVLSPEAAALYDLPSVPARVTRETVHNRFHPEDRLWLLPRIEQVLDPQGNGIMDLEHRIVLTNGETRWLQVRKQVFFSPAGAGAPQPLRSLLAAVDITARKNAEERLRTSEAHLSAILYHMPAAVYILSTDHRYLLVNHRFEQENKIINAEIQGRSVYDRFPRAVADTLVANEQRALAAKAPVSSEEAVARNGETYYYTSIKAPLLNEAGEPYALVGISLDITERKAAEALLERYQLLAQQTRDIILFIDADSGELVEANQAAVVAYGYDHAALLTKNLADLRAPHTRADLPVRIAQANSSGILFETVHCHADGSTFPVEVSARGANIGSRRLILSIVRDITVRKAEEAALRASQQRLQMALEAAQMGVWEWNMAERAIHWSPEVYQINGVSSFDGTPAASNRTVYPTDLSSVQTKVAQAIQQRIPYTHEFRVLRPDGNVQWVATYGRAEYGPDGTPLYLRAVVQNVNVRKRAELHQQFLLDLNAALNRLDDADRIQQTVVERLGQYLAASRCFFNQVDLAADRATLLAAWGQPGESPIIDIYPVSAHVPPADIAYAQAGRTLVVDDVPHVDPTQAPTLLWTQDNVQAMIRVPCLRHGEWVASLFVAHATPRQWRADEVQLVESVVQHFWPLLEKSRAEEALRRQEEILRQWSAILEQRVAERTSELEKKNIELERSNRELEKFAYVAAHDLRSPLRAIDSLSKWVAEDSGHLLLDTSKEHLAKIQGRIQRMDKLLNDLLAYSHISRVDYHLETVDVGQMLQEIIALLHIPATFRVTLAEGLPSFRTPRVPLEIVLRNLISNAVKHHHRPDGHVHVIANEEGDLVHFVVSDDGPGIDPQFHTKIFEIFQTLQPRDTVEGSGMGLAIVKKVIEIAEGAIRIESSIGAGATFHFTWPRASLRGMPKVQK